MELLDSVSLIAVIKKKNPGRSNLREKELVSV